MSVRAKFRCVKNEGENGGNWPNIELEAVTSGSPENDQFFKWTPAGRLTLGCTNSAASEQIVVGQEYYIDISPVPQS